MPKKTHLHNDCVRKALNWKTPTVGLEPTTTRLRALRSTDWARRAWERHGSLHLRHGAIMFSWTVMLNSKVNQRKHITGMMSSSYLQVFAFTDLDSLFLWCERCSDCQSGQAMTPSDRKWIDRRHAVSTVIHVSPQMHYEFRWLHVDFSAMPLSITSEIWDCSQTANALV